MQAADDVDAIAAFIAKDSPAYAGLFASRILESVEGLCDNPHIGRVVPELGEPSIRELIVGRYRIIYRTNSDVIAILTIIHGARLFDGERI